MADSDCKRAVTHLVLGQYEQAIVAFTEAIQDDPENPDLYKGRAACCLAVGDDASAAKDLSKAQELSRLGGSGPTAQDYLNRGHSSEYEGDYDRAIAHYTEAIRLDPRNALAYKGRGDAYSKKGGDQKAAADYAEARRLIKEQAPVHVPREKSAPVSNAASFWDDPFDESDYFTGPPLTEEMIQATEAKLGYRLPQSYLRLIRIKNGGSLKRSCFPTRVSTSGEEDYLELSGIRGIGGHWSIYDSRDEIHYPSVGIVIGETPSAGHDTFMLDYSECGPQGEPRVIHVETETDDPPQVYVPIVSVLAPDFETFLQGLVDCGRFDEEDA